MPRALRHEYPGAVYHVMARGDGGKAIFEGDDDRNIWGQVSHFNMLSGKLLKMLKCDT
jgi:hypothetical protein